MTAAHKLREMRRHLRCLIASNRVALSSLDAVMRGPSTPERGERVAAITNHLEISTDRAERFGLGCRK